MQQTTVHEKIVINNRMKFLGGNGMFKQMKKRVKNQKGLTLIELLAVVVILGIIAAIAIPAIGGIIDNSRYNAVKSDAINAMNAANLYFIDNPDASVTNVTVKILKDQNLLENAGYMSDTVTIYKANDTTSNKPSISINGNSEKYKGDQTVTFNYATIEDINTTTRKDGDTIPKAKSTP